MPNLSIPISKYVSIFSAFTGGKTVSEKEPIARIMTTNTLAPYGAVLEFNSLKNVLGYFGASSREYAVAAKYFGWVSKRMRRPEKISFARWSDAAVNAYLVSGINTFALNTLKNITAGTLNFSYTSADGSIADYEVSGIDLSSATSLADVATALATKISAAFTGCTVAFSTSLNGSRFVLTAPTASGGDSQAGYFSAMTSGADGLADLLGWSAANGVVISEGKDASTLADNLSVMLNMNNNFLTLAFLNPTDISLDQAVEVATWNEQQNVDAMFVVQAPSTSYTLSRTWQTSLAGFDGTFIQFDGANEDKYLMPMMACAAMDLSQEHSLIDLMFQRFPSYTPDNVMTVVGGLNLYEIFDSVNINYFASTQQAGAKLSFLQNGMLQGNPASATVYVGAWWLKGKIQTACMQQFLLNDAIYANAQDSAKFAGAVVSIWEQAKKNGCIQVGKVLSDDEKASITALTGDEDAWQKVQSQGYIFSYKIETADNGKRVFSYRLIYAACDTINSVEGTHIAITSSATE